MNAPLSIGAANATVVPTCGACDTLMSTLSQLVTKVHVSPGPNDVITLAAQAVGEVTDCIDGKNTGCNQDLQQLQQLILAVQNDAQQCAANAPASPCTTIVSDADTIEQQIIDTSGTCLNDSSSVCNAVLKDAAAVIATAQTIAADCLALTPGSACQTAASAAQTALAAAQNALSDCLTDQASTCQQVIHSSIGDISAMEAQAEALLAPPRDGGGTLPYLDVHDFQVTTQGAGEQQMVYDAAQNQYNGAYAVADAPVSNVYELPVVPKQVTDALDSAGNLVNATTTPEMQLIVAQTGEDFKIASVHAEDGSLIGFTIAAKAPAPIGMPLTTYQVANAAGSVGVPTSDSGSGKWYSSADPKCFSDSSYAWTKNMCSQFEIQDTNDNGNYYFQFQYWSWGHATDGYKVDKYWIEAVPDMHDTPGMQFDGQVSPTEAQDGSSSSCTAKDTGWNVTIGSGSPVSVGFSENTTVNSCEEYDPLSYDDTASHGHYAFEWHGNPAASSQRFLKINVALKCATNADGVEYDLWFGQEKY